MAPPTILQRRTTRSVTRAALAPLQTANIPPDAPAPSKTVSSSSDAGHQAGTSKKRAKSAKKTSVKRIKIKKTTGTAKAPLFSPEFKSPRTAFQFRAIMNSMSTTLNFPFKGDPTRSFLEFRPVNFKLPFKDNVTYNSLIEVLSIKLPAEIAHIVVSHLGNFPSKSFPRFKEFTKPEIDYFTGNWFFRTGHCVKMFDSKTAFENKDNITMASISDRSSFHPLGIEIGPPQSRLYHKKRQIPLTAIKRPENLYAFAVHVDICVKPGEKTDVDVCLGVGFDAASGKSAVSISVVGEEGVGWEGRVQKTWWIRRDDANAEWFWEKLNEMGIGRGLYWEDVKVQLKGDNIKPMRVELAAYACSA